MLAPVQRLLLGFSTPLALATLILGGLALGAASQQDVGPPVKRAAFMRMKLNLSQQVLEGIVREDYDLVAKSAQTIETLTLDEQWRIMETEAYAHQSKSFRHAAESLVEAAKAKNPDAVSLAYVDMTLSCVKCHKLLRKK